MIHTGMLTLREISTSFWNYKLFESMPDTHWDSQKGYLTNEAYRDQGIRLYGRVIQPDPNGGTVHVLMVRVNFHRLLTWQGSVTVAREEDYEAVRDAFNILMESIGLPDLSRWTASRIDYCVNITTPNVATYIKLLKRGTIPWYWRDRYIDETGQHGQSEGSLYLVPRIDRSEERNRKKTGSRIVNVYDKADQLRKEGADTSEIAEAGNVLRIEVQCFKPRLRGIKNRERLPDMSLESFWNADICQSELKRALSAITRTTCDYVAKSKAKRTIQDSSYHTETKERLRELIDNIANTRQAWGLSRWQADHGA